jgi:alkanesulfonate monooxygenase SsuD/methylene tetrahydromethanopterin reductase-like flavin-dependent oxidoreductase (luciferase family)
MRFTLNLSFLEPENYVLAARIAEAAGYDTISVSDSVFFPKETSSKYPYNDEGTRGHFEDKPFIDAFAVIPAMGAVTERVMFVPCVLKLPIRNPVIVAKLASSVAVLTGNRFKLLGVTDARVALRLRPYNPQASPQLSELADDSRRFASWMGLG